MRTDAFIKRSYKVRLREHCGKQKALSESFIEGFFLWVESGEGISVFYFTLVQLRLGRGLIFLNKPAQLWLGHSLI